MICLRCGYCCFNLEVVIVKPSAVDEIVRTGEIREEMVTGKHTHDRCPHFEWRLEAGEDIAHCKIHHLAFYEQTPCFGHTQIEKGNTPCRIGKGLRMPEQRQMWKSLTGREVP